MSDELVIRGKRGDFNDYEKFITKFKAAKTTETTHIRYPRKRDEVHQVSGWRIHLRGGYLLSSKAAAERAAAERAAAEVVKLTPQELDGKIKPFYDQTLF